MDSQPTIAVVGAGIGGLAFGAALAAVGRRCDIFEQAAKLGEVGAGIQLAPNAVRPLQRLGLGDALSDVAVRIEASEVRDWRGAPIARTPLGEDCERRFGAPYYAVHRADLHSILLDAVGPDSIRLGHRLVRLNTTADCVRLTFAAGSAASAQVVVGADGIRSVVRTHLIRDAPIPAGLGIFRGLVPTNRLPAAARRPVVRLWLGPGGHIVCYPVSGGRQLSFAATTMHAGSGSESWSADGDPSAMLAAFAGWAEPVTEMLGAVDRVRHWTMYDRAPLDRWATDRLTVLGDAAHPMLPFQAQGANQSIEDAIDLATCLSTVEAPHVGPALARYAAARRERTAAVQRTSRGGAAHLHLPDGPARRERDRLLRAHAALHHRAWLFDYQGLDGAALA